MDIASFGCFETGQFPLTKGLARERGRVDALLAGRARHKSVRMSTDNPETVVIVGRFESSRSQFQVKRRLEFESVERLILDKQRYLPLLAK